MNAPGRGLVSGSGPVRRGVSGAEGNFGNIYQTNLVRYSTAVLSGIFTARIYFLDRPVSI